MDTHPHVLVPDLIELGLGNVFGLAFIGHKPSVRDTVMFIRPGDDALLVNLVGPPAERGHPVFNCSDREVVFLPAVDQGFNVLSLDGSGLHLPVAHAVQFVGHQRQHAFSIPLRGIAAFPAVPAQLFQCMV